MFHQFVRPNAGLTGQFQFVIYICFAKIDVNDKRWAALN